MADSGRIVNGAWMPAVDSNGYPIPDAYIRVFVNRTTTLASIYADEARTTLLPNPVYADSSGQFPPIWQDNTLMFSLEFGSVSKGPIATVDDLQPSSNIGGLSDKANRNLDNATRMRDAIDATSLAFQQFLDDLPPRPVEFGAEPQGDPRDGVVGSADALQAMLDAAEQGGTPLPINGVYYCEKDLDLRTAITGGRKSGQLMQRVGFENREYWTWRGTIIMAPGKKIKAYTGAAIRDLNIISLAASTSVDRRYLYTALKRIEAWTGTAIEFQGVNDPVRDGGCDVEVVDCTIVGFHTAIRIDDASRPTCERNLIDCTNGILISNIYDVGRFRDNHLWPFYTGNQFIDGIPSAASSVADASGNTAGRAAYNGSPPGFTYADTQAGLVYFRGDEAGKWWQPNVLNTRDGIAIGVVPGPLGPFLSSRVDGCMFSGNLTYGWKYGIALNAENYACQFQDNWLDGTLKPGKTTYGFYSPPDTRTVKGKFVNNHSDSTTIPYYLNGDAGSYYMLSCNTGGAFVTCSVYLGAGHGRITDMHMGGHTGLKQFITGVPNPGKWFINGVQGGAPSGSVLIGGFSETARRNIIIRDVGETNGMNQFDAANWTTDIEAKHDAGTTFVGDNLPFKLLFETVPKNGLAEFSSGTWTCSRKGTFMINLSVGWRTQGPSAGTGEFAVDVVKNSAPYRRLLQVPNWSPQTDRIESMSLIVTAAAGDAFDINVAAGFPGMLSNTRTYIQIVRLNG